MSRTEQLQDELYKASFQNSTKLRVMVHLYALIIIETEGQIASASGIVNLTPPI